jgi:hypothetical protein
MANWKSWLIKLAEHAPAILNLIKSVKGNKK